MFFPESQVRVWLFSRSTDARKSYDKVVILTRKTPEEKPFSGQLSVFINHRRKQYKVFYFEQSGYCIWSKRLQQSSFRHHWQDAVKHSMLVRPEVTAGGH